MSNILDALRKAQSEQKPVPTKPAAATDPLLSHRPAGSGPSAANRRAIIIGCCGLLLLAIVAWLLYGPSKKNTELAQAPSPAPAAQLQESQPQPPPPSLPLQEQQPPQASPTAPLSPVPPETTGKQEPTVAAAQAPLVTANEGKTGSRRRRKSRWGISQVAQPAPPATSESAPYSEPPTKTVTAITGNPDGIKLTGIAWQASHKLRRAVLNDVLVGEGASVAGAKVLEIKQNTVKLEKNGLVSEITLLK